MEPLVQALVELFAEPLVQPLVQPLVEPLVQPLVELLVEPLGQALVELFAVSVVPVSAMLSALFLEAYFGWSLLLSLVVAPCATDPVAVVALLREYDNMSMFLAEAVFIVVAIGMFIVYFFFFFSRFRLGP